MGNPSKSSGIITDQMRRDDYLMREGSRRLCAAILTTGKTHGPCDAVKAIAYANNKQLIG